MRGFILVSHSLLFLPVSPILSLQKHYIVIYRCATATCTLLNVHLAVAQHTGGRCAAVSKNVGLFQGIRIITCVFSKDSINGKKQDAMITFIQGYCIVQDVGSLVISYTVSAIKMLQYRPLIRGGGRWLVNVEDTIYYAALSDVLIR